MPTFKVSLRFEGLGHGWSESFYVDGLGDHVQVANLMTRGAGLLQLRVALMTRVFRVSAIAVSNVDAERDGLVAGIAQVTGRGTFAGGLVGQAEQAGVDDAVNLRCTNTPNIWRSYLVRGIPKAAFEVDGTLKRVGDWWTALQGYMGILRTTGISIRKSTVNPTPTVITAFARSNGVITGMTLAAPIIGLTRASTLVVKDADGISHANGRYRVTEIDGNNVRVIRRQVKSYGDLVAGSALARLITYTYPQITFVQPVGLANRQTGRPIGESRGRALVRRS